MNATLLGQAISFTMFVWFCMKYVWPPVMQAIEERQKKIADGLAAAERAAKDLDLAQANASDQMKEAKRTATEIIEQANKRKAQIIDEAREDAQAERQKILHKLKLKLKLNVAVHAMSCANKLLLWLLLVQRRSWSAQSIKTRKKIFLITLLRNFNTRGVYV